jgi:ketosteroid isomerase-like protein
MSEENVELARSGYEAYARGDIEAVLALLDSAIEVRPEQESMGEDSYRGHEGFLKYVQRWLEPWDEYRLIPEQFIDAADKVLVIYRAVGRGKGSGIEVESRWSHLWTIRDGKAVRLEIFAKPDEGLRAAGLSE